MSKRDSSRKGERVQKAKLLPAILEGRMFYLIENDRHSVNGASIAEFDAWADSFCDEIGGVDRAVWDVFARWQFIYDLIENDVLVVHDEGSGTILLIETEEKISAEISNENASQAS